METEESGDDIVDELNSSESPMIPYETSKKKPTKDFKMIVIEAIDKCRIEGSKEMKKGTEKRILVDGMWTVVTIPDQRKVYSQCVMQLYDLLYFYFDKEMEKKMEELNSKINNAGDKFFEKYLQSEYFPPYKERAMMTRTVHVGKRSSVGERILQEFEDYKYNIYREMSRELILLFKRKNELSTRRIASIY